jgi:hypothetical protein
MNSLSKQRLSYDVQKILPHIRNSKNVLIIGCGDQPLGAILNDIIGFNKLYLTDIDEMNVFHQVLNAPLNTEGYKCDLNTYIPSEIDKVDTVILYEIKISIDTLESLYKIIDLCKNKTLIIKAGLETLLTFGSEINKTFKVFKSERLYPKILDNESSVQLIIGKS